MNKKLLQATCTKKLENFNIFFNVLKAYKTKEKFISTIRVLKCSQSDSQNWRKLSKMVPIFATFLSYFSTKEWFISTKM